MAQRTGRQRKLTDAQIQEILAWYAKGLKFRARWGTQQSLARHLRVRAHLIHTCIERYRKLGKKSLSACRVKGTPGRPRSLQVQQARAVIAWHLRYQRFLGRHATVKVLAYSLGVSERTVHACIGRQGSYRELAKLDALTPRASPSPVSTETPETQIRSALLKNWRRSSS